MPHATLLVMTSPMLLSPLPPAAVVETSVAFPQAVVAEAAPAIDAGPSVAVMPLVWSLSAGQEQPEEPLDEGSESAIEPQEGTDANRDEGSGEGPGESSGEGNVIVVEGAYGPPESDPIAEVNEASYRIVQGIDSAITGPLAYGYRDALPGPLRDGLGNVVRNLSEPANFLNYLLQFKIGKAFETLGRFAINSTIGVGGLFDVAGSDNIGLPYRRNGFANTLGYYGVEPGAYLYLPIAGATTVRDLIGNTLDQAVLPTAFGRPFNRPEFGVPYFVISNLESRLEVDDELAMIEDTIDPYAARRDTYLARREREIALLRGEEPPEPPAILQELEGTGEFADDFEYEDEVDEGAEGDTQRAEGAAEPDDGALDAPSISYVDTLEVPQVAVAIAITQPRTR